MRHTRLDGFVAVAGASLLTASTSFASGGPCTAGELSKFLGSAASGGDEYGRAVAIHGDVAVIGALNADAVTTDSGAAYVYRFDGSSWNEEAMLIPSDQPR